MRLTCILTFLYLSLAVAVYAQTDTYRFSRINVEDGLSNNQIKTIWKDRTGFLWIGTVSGLNRYDGYTIRTFTHQPGDSSSLINSEVNKLFEGPEGKIWIHTWSGLNIYDPLTEKFERDIDPVLASFSVPSGQINDIRKDSQGNFWFIHATEGLFRYSDRDKSTIRLQHKEDDETSVASNRIASWAEDSDGNLWIVHSNGILEKIDPVSLQVVVRNRFLNERFRQQSLEYNVVVDADNDLWFYIGNQNAGLFYFNPRELQWLHIGKNKGRLRLNSDIVKGIVQDDSGVLWVATDHGGINLVNKKDFSVKYILHNAEDEKSLGQNSINVLYKDYDGIIWAGTFKNGLSYYHKNINRFRLYQDWPSSERSLPFNDVNAVVEDARGNLWIGTNGAGLIYFDRKNNSYKQYLHDPSNRNSLSTNVIVSLLLDRNNILWIGTYFGGLLSYDGDAFVHYKHDPDDPLSISDNSVWEIFEDTQGALWIGTLSRGVNRFDRETGTFRHYDVNTPDPIHASYITAFMEDREGNLWIGTGYGIEVLEKRTGKFVHYLNQTADKHSLSNNSVMSIYEDSRGLIWIATHGGLNLFDRVNKRFRVFTRDDGLPHNSVVRVLEDDQQHLWVSTLHGLSNVKIRYTPGERDSLSIHFKNYDENDGLQGIHFNENAACKTATGELIFGGPNGFNLFRPEDVGVNRKLPKVILTEFQVFNKSVPIGELHDGKIILTRSITHTDAVVLDHADNVFSIEFAALSQFHPEKIRYQYMLEGFDKEWRATDARHRKITYTNLDPGEYVFKVKAANNDAIWSSEPTALHITVRPPFWRSGTAFVLYALAMLTLLLLARWLILHNERIKFQIDQEREKAQRMHELDMIKIKFFTNVSHEFRTPLSLILTPLEKILTQTPDGDRKKQLQLIHRNARRLLNLVNQLLDFRRMEVQEVKLNTSAGDIVRFIRDVFSTFSDLSEKNHIDFTFKTSVHQLETFFDQDKLEKILFNLLSNAFKFTPEHGAVSIALDVKVIEEARHLEIKVTDTGIGIPADELDRIFERFFQHDLPKSMVNQGSGIGLSITREFVKIHGGTIQVESEVGKGSCFTVLLPLTEAGREASVDRLESTATSTVSNEPSRLPHFSRKPVLLLVEDNEDFRFYLKDNLKINYSVVEARNGREGLERAVAVLPDLIVSDIMMPEMDGVELCRRIREDSRTSHIPFIMLTARSAEEQMIEGYGHGANDYVLKPFNFEILQSRIKNLIAQREAFQKQFGRHVDVKAANIQITSLDEKLIKRAIKVVEENIGEPDFSVEKFSKELGMSRVHLYKKLLALTGKTPIEFIRHIRLQRAAQLLEKSQLTVSEIAYQVGFNNPKYFSKYFKDQFNILPSAYGKSVEL